MTGVLKRAHPLQRDRATDVDVGRRDVDPELDPQRTPQLQLRLERHPPAGGDGVACEHGDVVDALTGSRWYPARPRPTCASRAPASRPPDRAQPSRCSPVSISSRSSCSTSAAPCSPAAARPQSAVLPTSTARAPSASATRTSDPRRMPPSTQHLEAVAGRVHDLAAARRASPARGRAGAHRGSRRRHRPRRARPRARRPRRSSTPLTHHGHAEARHELLDVAPVERRIDDVEPRRRRYPRSRARTTVGHVVLGHRPRRSRRSRSREPTHREVDREHDRGEPGLERLGDQLVGQAPVAEDVDLVGTGRRPGAAAATAAGVAVANEERQRPQPAAAAARAIPSSPSACAVAWYATGATTSGAASSCPRTVVAAVARSMPASTRGRKRWRPYASTLARSVRSSPAPPTKYSTPGRIEALVRERLDVRQRDRRRHTPEPNRG